MTPFEIIRKAMLAGFGVQEKINEYINDLVAKGELSDSQGAKLVKEWTEKAEKSATEMNQTVTDLVNAAIVKVNLASKDELEKLSLKVQALSARVKKLEDTQGGGTSQE